MYLQRVTMAPCSSMRLGTVLAPSFHPPLLPFWSLSPSPSLACHTLAGSKKNARRLPRTWGNLVLVLPLFPSYLNTQYLKDCICGIWPPLQPLPWLTVTWHMSINSHFNGILAPNPNSCFFNPLYPQVLSLLGAAPWPCLQNSSVLGSWPWFLPPWAISESWAHPGRLKPLWASLALLGTPNLPLLIPSCSSGEKTKNLVPALIQCILPWGVKGKRVFCL